MNERRGDDPRRLFGLFCCLEAPFHQTVSTLLQDMTVSFLDRADLLSDLAKELLAALLCGFGRGKLGKEQSDVQLTVTDQLCLLGNSPMLAAVRMET